MNKIEWIPEGNSNYKSKDGKYVAIFSSGYRGLCSYKVFLAETPIYDRKDGNYLSIGGLPEREFWLKKGNDSLPAKRDLITKHGNAKDGCNICGSRMNVIARILPVIGKMNVCMSCIVD